MSYTKRFVTLFRRPSESVQEIVKYPCFFKTSVVIILCGLGYIIIAELGLFRSLMPHFIAAYALMFTIIWMLPTVLSLVFFKIIGKRFNTESYLEASALSIFSVLTIGFIFLFGRDLNVFWVILTPIILAIYQIPAVAVFYLRKRWKRRGRLPLPEQNDSQKSGFQDLKRS